MTAALAKMPEKRNGKPIPDKKGLKSMKDFLHDFFNPPKFVKPTETKKVLTWYLNVIYCTFATTRWL